MVRLIGRWIGGSEVIYLTGKELSITNILEGGLPPAKGLSPTPSTQTTDTGLMSASCIHYEIPPSCIGRTNKATLASTLQKNDAAIESHKAAHAVIGFKILG